MQLSPPPLSVDSGQLVGVLVGLFLLSALYAIALELAERRWAFVSDYTWLAVVIGVGYTVAALAVLSLEAALLALFCFAASGLPIIVRAVVNDVRRRGELREYLARRGNGDDLA